MMLIGIDPHKTTHTATAVESALEPGGGVDPYRRHAREYRRMLTWANQWPQRRWAVENAEGLGRHLTSWLVARGELVVDVPTTATARVRQLSRGGGRKNDRIDAAAAACVAALQGDARPMEAEGPADAIAVLDERRVNLAQSRVRAVNQLHALLRAPYRRRRPSRSVRRRRSRAAAHGPAQWCGGAGPQGRRQRPGGRDPRARHAAAEPTPELSPSSSPPPAARLTHTVGVGPIMAGRLISSTGRASRFPTSSAFANYAGAAPVEIASADESRHRLSRHGDRQLNSALHTIAITQIRMPSSSGHRYYKTKLEEGKTPREAARCLKRRLADHLWRTMINDERRGGGSGRTPGDDSAIQRGWLNPNHQLFGQVTSQTRHPRLYDSRTSRLTNTEAPKSSDRRAATFLFIPPLTSIGSLPNSTAGHAND